MLPQAIPLLRKSYGKYDSYSDWQRQPWMLQVYNG